MSALKSNDGHSPEPLDITSVNRAYASATGAGRALLRAAMNRLGFFEAVRSGVTVETLRDCLGILPAHGRLFAYLLEILADDRCVLVEGGLVSLPGGRPPDLALPDLSRLQRDVPDMAALLNLLSVCLEAYPDVLTGKRNPMEVLFPGGSFDLLEGVYQGDRITEYFNALVAQSVTSAIAECSPAGRGARILEIGAGVGGTSRTVLAAIAERPPARYDFTDISPGFVHQARLRWGRRYPFAQFGVLNIENDVSAQGFERNSCDVVVAVNVLHATRDMANTLAQAARLLRPGGRLVIGEVTRRHEFICLIFGLTPGWWLYEDAGVREPHSPILRLASWRRVMAAAGLELTDVSGLHGDDMSDPVQAVMVARSRQSGVASESAADHRQSVAGRLLEIVARVSGLRVGQEDFDTNLFALGLDSLVLMQVRQGIERDLGVDVGLTQFHEELSTISRLAAWLAERMPVRQAASPAVAAAETRTPSQEGLVSPEAHGRQAATGAVHSPSHVTDMIQRQLELMEQQLEALKAIGSGATAAEVPVPPQEPIAVARERAPASGRPRGTPPGGTAAPLTPRQRASLDRLIARYTGRTRQSKAYAAAARPVLADWIATIGFRPELKEMIYPIVSAGSKGSHIWDIDGNEYVDLAMGFGVGFFGHSPAFVTEAIKAELERGFELATQSRLAAESARMIAELTGVERVVFSNTGTEAIMTAFRLARAATGRRRIVHFRNSFHGSYDGVMACAGEGTALPLAPGILQHQIDDVLVLEYGSDEALRVIEAEADSMAGVLVEPVQSRNPDLQPRAFLHELRRLTEALGIALIFDELITGFRILPGGAQAYFGVTADIVTYGKMIGAGMPISVIAGKARFIDAIDGGQWQFGDDSRPPATMTFFGGTFIRHPLAMAATHAALRFMKERGAVLQQEVNSRTARLAARLDELFGQHQVPFRVAWFASQFQIRHRVHENETIHSLELAIFFFHLLARGVYTWERHTCFLSLAHDDADLDKIVAAVSEALVEMCEAGFFARGDAAFR